MVPALIQHSKDGLPSATARIWDEMKALVVFSEPQDGAGG